VKADDLGSMVLTGNQNSGTMNITTNSQLTGYGFSLRMRFQQLI